MQRSMEAGIAVRGLKWGLVKADVWHMRGDAADIGLGYGEVENRDFTLCVCSRLFPAPQMGERQGTKWQPVKLRPGKASALY